MTEIVKPAHGCMHDDIEIIPMTGAVHCTNCGMWWHDTDALPAPAGHTHAQPEHDNTHDDVNDLTDMLHANDEHWQITEDDYPADWEDKADYLNPDNEPDSEANTWQEEDK